MCPGVLVLFHHYVYDTWHSQWDKSMPGLACQLRHILYGKARNIGTLGMGWEERRASGKHGLLGLHNLFLYKLKFVVLMGCKGDTFNPQSCYMNMYV